MKCSCVEMMLGDLPLAEKFERAAAAGFDGIDLRGDSLGAQVAEVVALIRRTGVEVPTVYGRLGTKLLGATVAERAETVQAIRTRLSDATAVGARSLIVVPIFGEPAIVDVRTSDADAVTDTELTLLRVLLAELEPAARAAQVQILLEPLNRRETHLLRSPAATARLTRAFGSPWIATMADTYHMDLEGQDFLAEVSGADDQLRLVHLSDRSRSLPGEGGIDFGPLLNHLHRFDGYLGFECKGPFTVEQLQRSVEFVRKLGAGS